MAHVEQQHADAILALLRADIGPPPLNVYDGKAPDPLDGPIPTEYLLVYFYTTRPDGTSLTNEQDRAVTRAVIHCAGANAIACRAMAGRAAAALLNVTPSIEGRECWPIRDDNSPGRPEPDDSTNTRVMSQIVIYRLESVPDSG